MSWRILLLTKNYPPQIWGIEKYAYDLYNKLVQEWNDIKIITAGPRSEFLLANKQWNIFWSILYIFYEIFRLFSFWLKAFFGGLWWCLMKKGDLLVWSIDWSIAWLGVIIARSSFLIIGHKKNIFLRATGHGRDIAFNHYLYQKILHFWLVNTDDIFVVSQDIKKLVVSLWIDERKIEVKEHSLETISLSKISNFDRTEFLWTYKILPNKVLLFSIGRFVEKKWFHWFIAEVLPYLDNRFHYILAGSGPLEDYIRRIVRDKNLHNITLVWPIVDSVEKGKLYSSVDYFLMPNISVKWDYEGYGIVLLESQFYNLKSIVANTDGINTRVTDHDVILPSGIATTWVEYLNSL